MYWALALARNATALAISSALPYRPSAMNCRSVSADGPCAGFMSVSMEPGCTRLTVTSFGPSSRANAFVNATSADFDAAYTPRTGVGTPAGCMAMLAAVSDEWPTAIVRVVRKVRLEMLGMLRSRLETAVAKGELPASTDIGM